MAPPIQNLVLISFDPALADIIERAAGDVFRIVTTPEISSGAVSALSPNGVVVCIRGSMRNYQEDIRTLIESLGDTPVWIIASNADAREVVTAYQCGIKEFFLWPDTVENIRASLFKYAPPRRKWFETWVNRISSRLFKAAKVRVETHAPEASETGISDHAGRYDLYARMLGGFSLSTPTQQLPPLSGRQSPSLLAYFLLHRDRSIRRETLLDTFWPDRNHESGRNSLNVTLHSIRRYLKKHADIEDLIVYSNGAYRINPDLLISLDIENFTRLWEAGNRLEASGRPEQAITLFASALALYNGNFLDGFQAEEWTAFTRDTLADYYLRILEKMMAYRLDRKEYDKALRLGQQYLRKDTREEGIHRLLMKCFIRMGLPEKALRQYETCREILQREWGVSPSAETQALYEEIVRKRK